MSRPTLQKSDNLVDPIPEDFDTHGHFDSRAKYEPINSLANRIIRTSSSKFYPHLLE
jgi:hypothetical protein